MLWTCCGVKYTAQIIKKKLSFIMPHTNILFGKNKKTEIYFTGKNGKVPV